MRPLAASTHPAPAASFWPGSSGTWTKLGVRGRHRRGSWKGAGCFSSSLQCFFPSAHVTASGCAFPVGSGEPMPRKVWVSHLIGATSWGGSASTARPYPLHCAKQSLVTERSVFEFLCLSLFFLPLFYLLFLLFFFYVFLRTGAWSFPHNSGVPDTSYDAR